MARVAAGMVVIAAMLLAPPAFAHKLKVFATAVGAQVDGSVYFVGSGPAPGARISIETADGQPVETLQADTDGNFSFIAISHTDHLIKADTGDGHSAQITIAAEDLPASLPSPTGSPASAASLTLVPSAAAAPAAPAVVATPPASGSTIEDLVAKAVAQQIRPLREEINAYEDQVRLRDIAGGIGYIVGLAGLTLWLRDRHRERRPERQPERQA